MAIDVSVQYNGGLLPDIIFSERAARGGRGEGRLPDFFFSFFFSCSANHERDWPPCKVVFFGLATNALNVRNSKQQQLLTLYHEEVLYLQPMIPPKRFDIFPPDRGILKSEIQTRTEYM